MHINEKDASDRLDAAVARAERAEAEAALLAAVLGVLVRRFEIIHADELYKMVWQTAQLHLGYYTGPTYSDELEQATDVLVEHANNSSLAADVLRAAEETLDELERWRNKPSDKRPLQAVISQLADAVRALRAGRSAPE